MNQTKIKTMGKNSFLKFGLGVLTGVGIAMYLNSEQGKKMVNEVSKKAEEAKDDLMDYMGEETSKASRYLRNTLDAAKDSLTGVVNNASDKFSDVSDFVKEKEDTIVNEFEAGIEEAKAKIKREEEKLKRGLE